MSSELPLAGAHIAFRAADPVYPRFEPRKNRTCYLPLFAFALFLIIVMAPVLPRTPTAHSCLAILCTVCFLWITEAIPPFATAYLIPMMAVWLRIGLNRETGARMSASGLAQYFAVRFMHPMIFVFLGSFCLSAAFQKLDITTRFARSVLGLVVPRRSTILLVLMLLNVAVGALLSNVTSTTLTLSLALPLIRSLNPKDPFVKALLLGIAWSGNCGGQPTTIASPQNVIAATVVADAGKPVSFLAWMFFGTTVSIVLCVAQWFYLTVRFHISSSEVISIPSTVDEEPWSTRHTETIACTIVTILLWILADYLQFVIGHIGIVSLVPIVWLFGSGILTANDLNSLKWSALSLLGGGLALAEAMRVSGLLEVIAVSVRHALGDISPWALLIIFLVIEGVLASLLSSTAAASIILPLIMAIGATTGHAPLLVILSALMISSAQLFPISSFPNALVSGVCIEAIDEDPGRGIVNGGPFLTSHDYMVYGAPTVALAAVVVATLGYALASLLGF
jgi:phosphate transporter